MELVFSQAISVHVPNMAMGVANGLLTTLIPVFARSVGASDSVIGLVIAALGIGQLATSVWGGFLAHETGMAKAMSAGFIIYMVGCFVEAVATESLILTVGSFIWGCGIGVFSTARHLLLAKCVESKYRGRLMSLVGAGFRWSYVIGPILCGWVIQVGGFQIACLVGIPMCFVGIICVMKSSIVRKADMEAFENKLELEKKIAEENGGKKETAMQQLWRIGCKYKGIAIKVGFYASTMIGMRTCRRMMLPLAAMNLGLEPWVVGLIVSISFLFDATMFWVGGILMDKMGRQCTLAPVGYFYGIAFALLPLASSFTTLILLSIFFGFADCFGSGMLLTLIADSTPKDAGGPFMGLLRQLQVTGTLLWPLLAGWFVDWFSFSTSCIVLSWASVIAGIWAAFLLVDISKVAHQSHQPILPPSLDASPISSPINGSPMSSPLKTCRSPQSEKQVVCYELPRAFSPKPQEMSSPGEESPKLRFENEQEAKNETKN